VLLRPFQETLYYNISPYIFNPDQDRCFRNNCGSIGIWKRRLPGAFYKAPSQIAIGIRNPVKKVRISENLINTKKSMNIIHERTQIKIEFLKDACTEFILRIQTSRFMKG